MTFASFSVCWPRSNHMRGMFRAEFLSTHRINTTGDGARRDCRNCGLSGPQDQHTFVLVAEEVRQATNTVQVSSTAHVT